VVGTGPAWGKVTRRGPIHDERIQVGPRTQLIFRNATCVRVDFSQSTIPNFGAFGSTFQDCDFTDCVIESGLMGHLPPVTYRDCDFSGADLRGVGGLFARFERCRFIDARLDSWRTEDSEFVDCIFAGRIRSVVFWGRPGRHAYEPLLKIRTTNEFRGNDFTAAELVDCSFCRGIDLDANRWPQGPEYVILREAAAKLGDAMTRISTVPEEQRAKARRWLEILVEESAGQRDLLLRFDDLPAAVRRLLGLDDAPA
jgi:hypothetical protein